MRLLLDKKKQEQLMNAILCKITVGKAAKVCSLSERTIRDWRRAKFSINAKCLYKLCRLSKIDFPKNCELRSDYWYAHKSSLAGMKSVCEKYGSIGGDPEYRKKRWREWWEKEGKYKSKLPITPIKIKKPRFSKELAEFVGIVLGDGGITKTQVRFTLHIKDDKDYGEFISKLTNKLFDVRVAICTSTKYSARIYYVSRKELVSFLVNKVGLKIGSKVGQQIDIPEWIKNNESYSRVCVRGLIDTDGSVFIHKYKVNGKEYRYKKLVFTNYSRPLLDSVFKILVTNGLNPRLSRGVDVCLDSKSDVEQYFKKIGSNNPKHLNKRIK